MNSIEIQNKLRNLECFKGVYPIDLINKIKEYQRPLAIVVNLDPSYMSGSHWIVLFITVDNIGYYFDSFGLPFINEYILDFFRNNLVSNIYYNTNSIQSIKSASCGSFCVLFVRMLCNKFSFEQFLKLFTNNKDTNEKLIKGLII